MLSSDNVFQLFLSGITIIPLNKNFGSGLKSNNDTLCRGLVGEKFIQCIEGDVYSVHDINMTTFSFYNKTRYDVKAKPFLISKWQGIGLALDMESAMITHLAMESLQLNLNNSLSYFIQIMDPKLQILSDNPDAVPRIMISKRENTGSFLIYLKVSLSKWYTSVYHNL